ncbi:hypothetical protein [Mycoplasma sp. P36-A1]|uniref:hypothetical protein n=1 Tax=Mycoplasma sp. P36-A1 TaxID=3252900 RepID=UPI003C2D929A
METAIEITKCVKEIIDSNYNEKRIKTLEKKLKFIQELNPTFPMKLLDGIDEDIYFSFENKCRDLMKSIDYENEEKVFDFIMYLINIFVIETENNDIVYLSCIKRYIKDFMQIKPSDLIFFLNNTNTKNNDTIFENNVITRFANMESIKKENIYMDFAKLYYCNLEMGLTRPSVSNIVESNKGAELPYRIKACYKNSETKKILKLYNDFLNSNWSEYKET